MQGPRYTRLVADLPSTVPFVGPEAQERAMGRPFLARIGANENAFGPSPKAVAAMRDAVAESWKYADPESHDLRHALASHHGVDTGNIIIGEGIDALLGYVTRLTVEPDDAVVTSDGAYPTFNFHVAGYGGVLHKVPYCKDRQDPRALVARANETGAKLVYLTNPDNPMGTWQNGRVISDALDELNDGCLMILDEAYVEFAPAESVPDIAPDDPRVIRFRTFSKAYGMAGARVGYGIGAAELIAAFDRIRNHFGLNRTGQIGALAALADHDWLAEVRSRVGEARNRIAAIAAENDLATLPSATNFVAIDCGRDGDFARAVLAGLAARGVFVRMPFVAPQDRCIRVTAGKPEDLDTFAAALPAALAEARDHLR